MSDEAPTAYVDQQVAFLRELFTQRIDAEIQRLEEQIAAESARADARADASDRATETRTSTLEQRLAGMNEFRAALNDFAVRAATVEQLDSRTNPIRERLEKLENLTNRLVPAKDFTDKTELIMKDIDALKTAQSTQTGRASGVQAVFAAIVLLIVIAGFLFTWFRFQPKP